MLIRWLLDRFCVRAAIVTKPETNEYVTAAKKFIIVI
jgi:hypothetical protein